MPADEAVHLTRDKRLQVDKGKGELGRGKHFGLRYWPLSKAVLLQHGVWCSALLSRNAFLQW